MLRCLNLVLDDVSARAMACWVTARDRQLKTDGGRSYSLVGSRSTHSWLASSKTARSRSSSTWHNMPANDDSSYPYNSSIELTSWDGMKFSMTNRFSWSCIHSSDCDYTKTYQACKPPRKMPVFDTYFGINSLPPKLLVLARTSPSILQADRW